MKKRIFSLLFAICLIIPCAFLLSACGQAGGGEKFVVTKEEWNNALNWKGQTSVYIYSEQINADEDVTYSTDLAEVKYDGTNIHCKRWVDDAPVDSLVETFFVKDNNSYSRIVKGAKDNQTYQILKGEYDDVFSVAYSHLLQDLTYDDFEYDEATKSYVNNEHKITVRFTFKSDSLEKIVVEEINSNPGTVPFTRTTTIKIEPVTVELP